jgi:hypothetical protein
MAAMFANLEYFMGWLNVRNYGATGDGETDDTSAIQDAIDDAFAAGGGVVHFPPGDYKVGGTGLCLLLKSGVHLRGCGISTRIMNSTASADTIRCTGSAANWSDFSDFWAIRDIHFNPLLGVTRTTTAPEINVGMSREGYIEGCSFGRRNSLDGTDAGGGEDPTSTDEESRVGTCIQLGNSSTLTDGGPVVIRNIRGYGPYFRFLRQERFTDSKLSDVFVDANNPAAQQILLTGKVEACQWTNCDFVNTANVDGRENEFTESSTVLTIDNGAVRINTFTNLYFDTAYHGLDASAGFANHFVNCWFSNRPGRGARVRSSANGYTFLGCQFANNGDVGLSIEAGLGHLVQGCRFFANGISGTPAAHLLIGASVTGCHVHGNVFATGGGGLSGDEMDAVEIESGATGVRVSENQLGGLAVDNDAGAGATVEDNF